jgi:hypothetical protein
MGWYVRLGFRREQFFFRLRFTVHSKKLLRIAKTERIATT